MPTTQNRAKHKTSRTYTHEIRTTHSANPRARLCFLRVSGGFANTTAFVSFESYHYNKWDPRTFDCVAVARCRSLSLAATLLIENACGDTLDSSNIKDEIRHEHELHGCARQAVESTHASATIHHVCTDRYVWHHTQHTSDEELHRRGATV